MGKKGKLPTDVKAIARVHTDGAVRVLASIMHAHDAPHASRVAAAIYLINRGWGQPQQAIELSGEVTTTKVIRTPAISPDNSSWIQQHGEKTEMLQ